MASKIASFRSLVPELGSSLKAFQQSGARFRLLRTVEPTNLDHKPPSKVSDGEPPETLFILDSSFNPPSIAHQALAHSALHVSNSDSFPKPHRMLLLFSTMNADKAPSATSFDQRLTMMTIFATDILESMKRTRENFSVVSIDIGVTTAPYYTDKSVAIQEEGTDAYAPQTKHVHLVGFDTLTRFFAAKYYSDFDPPFSALNPYFDRGHRLRVTLRPDDAYGSVDDQQAFLAKLRDGEWEKEGAKRSWAEQIDMVPPNPRAGVSSTKIRKSCKIGNWEEVGQLCTPGVAAWVQSEQLYEEDDRGAKMA